MKGYRIRFFVPAVFLALPLAAVASGTMVFDSSGHSKAGSARVQVLYPEGFAAHESAEHDEIQVFVRRNGALQEELSLHVLADVPVDRVRQNMPVPGALPEAERHAVWRGQVKGENKQVHDVRDTAVGGMPAVLVTGSERRSWQGEMYYSRIEVMTVYDGRNILMLVCVAKGPEKQAAAVERLYAKSREAVCGPFFGSLRLQDATALRGGVTDERMDDGGSGAAAGGDGGSRRDGF